MQNLVTTVITVFNRGPAVRSTVDSALSQTLPRDEHEVIIVVDGSTDGTAAILDAAYGGNSQVRILHHQQQGVAGARNRGLVEARGKYIAYLDHDDRWLPDKLAKQVEAIRQGPAGSVVYCGWKEVDTEGAVLPDEEQMQRAPWWRPRTGYILDDLIPNNLIVSASVPLMRTDVVRRAGGWDARTVPCDDHDLWLRLARSHPFLYVPDDLVLYTRHSAQQSADVILMQRAMFRVLLKHWDRLMVRPAKLRFLLVAVENLESATLFSTAKGALVSGDFAGAWAALGRLMLRRPVSLLAPRWLVLVRRLLARNRTPYR